MTTSALVLETSDSTVTGSGTVDLGTETLDLRLLAHPKDASVLAASTQVAIEGTFRDPKIDVIWDSVVEEIVGDDEVSGVTLRNVQTGETTSFAADGVFVAIGHRPNTPLFEGQLELDGGYIVVREPRTTTSVPGVFAAGDVVDTIYRQAVTAAGMGCKAAIDAERFLEAEGR